MSFLSIFFQGHLGISISQPNEFEIKNRPGIIQHLPPLSAREVRLTNILLFFNSEIGNACFQSLSLRSTLKQVEKHAIGSVDVIKGASLTIREFLLKTKRYISSSKFYFNSFKFQEVYFHKIEVCPFANLKQFIKTFAQIVSVYLSEHFFEFLKKRFKLLLIVDFYHL